jgi:hypothetical protein
MRPAIVGLPLRLVEQITAEKAPEQQHQKYHHERCTDKFRSGELPAQKHQHDDAELKHHVGRGHFEGHRGREVGALAK